MSAEVLSQLYHNMQLSDGPDTAKPERPSFDASSASDNNLIRPSSSLQGLAVLSELAEHELALEELSGLVFQLQELRHTASASAVKTSASETAASDAPPPAGDSVDAALGRLTEKLEETESAWDILKQRCSEVADGGLVSAKVDSLEGQLETIRSDVDLLRSELGEDKYLTVFRSVSNQADEMMTSLEKILASCHEFIWEINRPTVSATSSLSSSPVVDTKLTSAASRKEQHHKLSTSLQAKKTYYVPSTKRVLSILGQGIAERRTQNGLVLKQYKEMRNRLRDVQERIRRVEQEMEAMQDQLEPANSLAAPTGSSTSASIASRDPSPSTAKRVKSGLKSSHHSPSSSSLSSIRRIASRLASSSSAATPESRSRADSEPPSTTPPRPKKNTKRQSMYALGSSSLSPPPSLGASTPPLRPPRSLGRPPTSQSPPSSTASLPRNVYSPASERARSPTYGSTLTPSFAPKGRPQWNSSVKRTSDSPSKGNRRTTLGGLGLPGPSTPSRTPSRAASAFGHYTPASMESRFRSFTPMPGGPPSYNARAPSPTYSTTSRASAGGSAKPRPESRNSRIPMPSSAKKSSRSRGAASSEVGSDDGMSDMGDTSLLSRAMSDQGDFSYYGSSTHPTSGGDGGELEEILSTPNALASSQQQSPFFRGQMMTPEPQMRATASKISSMTQHRSGGGSSSLRPPSAASGRISRSSMGGTTTTGASRRLSRVASPLPGSAPAPNYGMQGDGSYRPNPYDQLDLAVAGVVERQPLHVSVERIGQPLTKAMGLAQKTEDWTAQYSFQGGKPVQCKLIQRTRNGEVSRKCMIKSGGQWVDLDMWLLDLQSF